MVILSPCVALAALLPLLSVSTAISEIIFTLLHKILLLVLIQCPLIPIAFCPIPVLRHNQTSDSDNSSIEQIQLLKQ